MTVWTQLEPLLAKVQKPARYIGCEDGVYTPDHHPGAASWLLAYPDTYEIGLPNQGLQILAEIIREGRESGEFERKTPLDETVHVIDLVMQPYVNPLLLQYNLDVAEEAPVREGPQGLMRRVEKGQVGLLLTEITDKAPMDGYTDERARWADSASQGFGFLQKPCIAGDLLPAIRCPILAVHGTADSIVPFAHAERIARENPRGAVMAVAGIR